MSWAGGTGGGGSRNGGGDSVVVTWKIKIFLINDFVAKGKETQKIFLQKSVDFEMFFF